MNVSLPSLIIREKIHSSAVLECGTVTTATEPETRPHANMVLLCMMCMCATAYQNNAIVNSLENK